MKRFQAIAITLILISFPLTAQLIEVTGRVTDAETGDPLNDFTIIARSYDRVIGLGRPDPSGDGSFTLQFPTLNVVQIECSAHGYLPAMFRPRPQDLPDRLEPLEVRLLRGAVVSGTIVDEGNNPLAGVEVTPLIHWIDEIYKIKATSDEAGRYEMAGLPAGEITFTFLGDDVVARKVVVEIGEDREVDLDVVLSHGYSLKGTVTDMRGAPLEGALVMASSAGPDAASRAARTGPDGHFMLEGLSDASYAVTVRHEGFESEVESAVTAASSDDLLFQLSPSPTGSIFGIVEGPGNATLRITAKTPEDTESTTIAPNGDYRIDGLRAGPVEVTLERNGTVRARKVVVPAGGEIRVDFGASSTLSLDGRVTRYDEPLPGARVTLFTQDGTVRSSDVTDSEGHYRLNQVMPGTYDAQIDWQGPPHRYRLEIPDSTSHDFDLSGAVIRGFIIDGETSTPVRGARVSASYLGEDEQKRWATVETDERGQYEIGAVQAGSQLLRIDHPAYGPVRQIVMVRARHATNRNYKLDRVGGVEVKLVDAVNRRPLEGTIVARSMTGQMIFDGKPRRSTIGVHLPLPDGTYKISASADDYATETVIATVPGDPVTISLSRGGSVVIRSNDPARRVVELIEPNGEQYVQCWCNQLKTLRIDGDYTRLEHIAAGSYTLAVWDHQGKVRKYPIQVVEDRSVEVTID